ncbi:hypothetical protein ACFX15_031004 [Malus domestica]
MKMIDLKFNESFGPPTLEKHCRKFRKLLVSTLSSAQAKETLISSTRNANTTDLSLVDLDKPSGKNDVVIKLPKDPNVPNFGVQIVGSCNGFLCVYDRLNSCRFYISNPVIGESITLPRFPKDIGFPFLYGFGFCPVDGDYKLVVVSSTSNGLKSNEWEVMVLTVGTGSWRNVGNSVYPFGNQWYGVYHDGFLQWIARGDNSVLMPLMLKVSVSKSCHYRLVLWESVLLTLQS